MSIYTNIILSGLPISVLTKYESAGYPEKDQRFFLISLQAKYQNENFRIISDIVFAFLQAKL